MYIAPLLNKNKLFEHMGWWNNNTRDHNVNKLIDEFLFRVTSAQLNLIRINNLETGCLQQFRKQKIKLTLKSKSIAFYSPTFIEMLNEFSPYLSSLRIMQNMLLPLITKAKNLKGSVPSSLADAMKDIKKYGLDQEICDILTKYWSGTGRSVKEYRDIDQHYSIIINNSYLQVDPIEKVCVLFPDNPKTKNPKDFTFNKKIDGVDFINNCFNEFHQCFVRIFDSLKFSTAPHNQGMPMAASGAMIEEGIKKTLGIMIESNVDYSGIEVGQTEERKIYVQRLLPIINL